MNRTTSNSNNTILIVVAFLVCMGALLFAFKVLKDKEVSNEALEKELAVEVGIKKKLVKENTDLNKELDLLSIDKDRLEERIKEREETLAQLNREMMDLKEQLAIKDSQIRQYIREIKELAGTANPNTDSLLNIVITNLQADKSKLEEELNEKILAIAEFKLQETAFQLTLDSFKRLEVDYRFHLDSLDEQIIMLNQEVQEIRAIKNIVENTKVRLHEFYLTKSRNSKPLGNIRGTRSEKWTCSQFVFEFSHPDMNLLLNNSFALRIMDLDANNLLERNESSPNKDNMLTFEFEDQGMDKTFCNVDEKPSSNCEVQFGLVREDSLHLLYYGRFQIVKDKKVVKP